MEAPSTSQQTLVEGEQSLIDFKDVIVAVGNEVLHNDVKFAGVRERVSCFLQQFPGLFQRQLQGHGKGSSKATAKAMAVGLDGL